jgi:hypothetical protein
VWNLASRYMILKTKNDQNWGKLDINLPMWSQLVRTRLEPDLEFLCI